MLSRRDRCNLMFGPHKLPHNGLNYASKHIGITLPVSTINRCHLDLWKQIFPSAPPYQIESYVTDDFYHMSYFVVAFNTKAECDEFDSWWVAYSSRFDDVQMEKFPRIPLGKSLTGCFIGHDPGAREYLNAYDERWRWIIENTSGFVYWNQDFWFFELESEMIQFKLMNFEMPKLG